MASFSFGAGNAAKLLRIPLYAGGRLVTAVVPRSRDQWVFGCAVGIADGALALWEQSRGERAVWLVANERERLDAAARGIPTVPKHSLIGFWRTARARVIVVTHGFGDVNRYAVSGAYVVQLWHGIPLKRIGLDSPETTRMGADPRPLAVGWRRCTAAHSSRSHCCPRHPIWCVDGSNPLSRFPTIACASPANLAWMCSLKVRRGSDGQRRGDG